MLAKNSALDIDEISTPGVWGAYQEPKPKTAKLTTTMATLCPPMPAYALTKFALRLGKLFGSKLLGRPAEALSQAKGEGGASKSNAGPAFALWATAGKQQSLHTVVRLGRTKVWPPAPRTRYAQRSAANSWFTS